MSQTAGPKIVGVCGSLREGSHTRTALGYALEEAERLGGRGELLDLREFDLPAFDPGAEETADVRRLKTTIRDADALVLATPMYHGSYSSPLKTAIDYCGFDEFEHKTVGLLGVSGGSFPINALEHLRSVCRALDAWVTPYQAAVPNSGRNFEDGTLSDDDLRSRVETLGERVVRYARIEEVDPTTFESEENVGARD